MIVTTGKHIKIDVYDPPLRLQLECSAEAPGAIYVTDTKGNTCTLPGNKESAEEFIKAYRRVLAEDVGYRKMESE